MKPVQRSGELEKTQRLKQSDRQNKAAERTPDAHEYEDQYHPQERGDEHRYGRSREHKYEGKEGGEERTQGEPVDTVARRAKKLYQEVSALIHQRATHAPFHFDELGETQATVPSQPTQTPPLPYRRAVRSKPTRFYPHGSSERVEATAGVGRVRLQKVIPNYELSTAETRTSGLGPKLEN